MYGKCRRCECIVDIKFLEITDQYDGNLCKSESECDKRIEHRKGIGTLVKRKEDGITYYVDWAYDNWEDDIEPKGKEKAEDLRAKVPSLYYNKLRGKWCLDFAAADAGGYAVQNFQYFFDSFGEAVNFLTRGQHLRT